MQTMLTSCRQLLCRSAQDLVALELSQENCRRLEKRITGSYYCDMVALDSLEPNAVDQLIATGLCI